MRTQFITNDLFYLIPFLEEKNRFCFSFISHAATCSPSARRLFSFHSLENKILHLFNNSTAWLILKSWRFSFLIHLRFIFYVKKWRERLNFYSLLLGELDKDLVTNQSLENKNFTVIQHLNDMINTTYERFYFFWSSYAVYTKKKKWFERF